MNEQFVYSQKNNFSGGELTPTIEGRTELALYQNGVKKLINFMLLPSGGIMRRHGTQFVYLFEDNVPRKMITVMFSRQLSYLLVFESHPVHTKVSVFVDGNLYLTMITLDFHFSIRDFSCVVFQGIAYISFGSLRPIYKFSVDPEIVESFYEYVKENEHSENRNPAGDFPDKDRMFILEPMKCQINYFKNADKPREPKAFNEVIHDFEIDNINDELKNLHDSGDANIYERLEENLYCSLVVTFASRLWCFGADKNIHSIWASYKGDFSDFRMAYKTLLEARNPLTAFCATFSSSTFDNVLWSVPFTKELLLGTTDGIYLVKEGDRGKGEFISIHKELELPVSPIKPVVLGKTIFFVEGNNCKINSLFYSQEKGGFQVADITAFSEHIFAGGIKEIAGSNSPFSIIFAVLKDGSFAIFTYSQDLKIMGWCQHHLGGDAQVLGISTISADNEDRLYFQVRRPTGAGGYREYLEVLPTRYFSGKIFEMQKPVYADCHVNIGTGWNNSVSKQIEAAINNDTAYEFRGDITKLENIIAETVQKLVKLDIGNMNGEIIAESFKYDNRLIGDYEESFEEIENFLCNYYSNYSPVIFETLGAAFAYYRIFGNIYAELENIFLNEPEKLSVVENLLDDGERLGGDIVNTIENIIPDWQLPKILQNDKTLEYIPNSSFSFKPEIIIKLRNFNTDLIKEIIGVTTEIIAAIKSVIEKRFEVSQELNELRATAAKINKAVLLHYARESCSNDKNKDLLKIIREFFSDNPVGFYQELLNIAHPILTPYLFSTEVKEILEKAIAELSPDTPLVELQEQIRTLTAELVNGLQAKFEEHKNIEIASFKRQEELSGIIRAALLGKDLNDRQRQYVLSDEFKILVGNLMHGRMEEDDNLSVASVAASVAMSEAYSEIHEEQPIATTVYALMQRLQESLLELKRHVIDYCPLIMPNTHPSLLKNILEDENSIKLEKYLLLSKRYYSVFKKMFPDIGLHELGVIARNCSAQKQQLRRPDIVSVYGQNSVAIIGDEELHSIKILDDELIKLQYPVHNLSIGFPYKSVMQTFPFIFPDEVEHMPKKDVEIGIKLFNTKGGYIEIKNASGIIGKQHINSKYLDSDALIRFTNEKKYLATKEVSEVLATPYKSGWVYFLAGDAIRTDIDCSFVVDKPYPASILKIYAKARILPNYKGL